MKSFIVWMASVIPLLLQTAPSTKPSFDVASIKGGSAARPRIAEEPGGRFVATGVTLATIMGFAYRGITLEFSAKPGWIDTDLWDIEAKAPEGAVPPRTGPPDMTKPDTIGVMVQSLLEARFQLKTRRETRELPMYEVNIANGGLKMKLSEDQTPPARPTGPPPRGGAPRGGMRMGRGDFEGSAVSMANIVMTLGQLSGRRTIDKTGLTGLYDFRLQWTPSAFDGDPLPFQPRGAAAAAAPTATADPSGASLLTAIQEQLGLRLESTKGPVEVVVIESIQKPSAN
jgi:uncharacterized protein (TIGR03435 family)